MKIKFIVNTLKRTYDLKLMGLYVLTVFLCSLSSAVYANMRHIANANAVLLILCGGMINKNDFSILFAIWILPAIVAALMEGKAVERECDHYRYIAPRYGNRWSWYISEGTGIVARSICRAALLIAVAMLLCKAYGFEFVPFTRSPQGEDDILCKYLSIDKSITTELFVLNALRFSRIGAIVLAAQMLAKHKVQIGLTSVMILELISLLNTEKPLIPYTYLSACISGAGLPLAILLGAASVLCFLAIGAALLHHAITNGLL